MVTAGQMALQRFDLGLGVWQLLEAADAALETAEIMMEYHQRGMERKITSW